MLSTFDSSWQKRAPGNLKQTHMHSPLQLALCSYCTL